MPTITNKPKLLLFLFSFLLSISFVQGQKINEDSLKQLIATTKEDTTRIDAMLTYGNYLFRHKMQDSAGIAMITKAKQLSHEKNYWVGVATALLYIGNYYSDESNWEKCIEAYDSIIKISDRIPNEVLRKKARRNAYNNLGGIYNNNGDFTGSLENRLKALQITESMTKPNPNEIATIAINTASDYRQLKEFGKAKEYMAKVDKIFPDIQDRLKLEYFFEFYQISLKLDENVKAQQLLYKFDSILQVGNLSEYQKKDYSSVSQRLHGLYEVDFAKNYKKAEVYFQNEIALAKEMGETSQIGTATYNLAWALYEGGKYPEAINYLNHAYTLSIENDLKNQALKAASMLSDAYGKINNVAKAYEFSKISLNLKDSIVREEANQQLNFLDAKYQYEKKEKEITSLQVDNQSKEFQIRKKNWMILGAGMVALVLALIAYTVFRYYHSRQQLLKKEKSLQEEKIISMTKQQQVTSLQSMINGQETERTRIAKDLHDGLGGLLSTVKMHYSTLQQDTPAIKDNSLYRKTLDLINDAADQLRTVAHSMMPEVLMKVGLVEALQDFCNNISSGKLLKITLQSYGMEKRLNSSTEIMLYRIIQELVNNIIKHAQASEAIIQINRQGNTLHLIIEDNGRGFDTKEAEEKRSMGMTTIKSRVDYLNGKLNIESRKNIGTTVMIDLLLNEN